MLANFTSQRTSSKVYDVRAMTRVLNVSSCALTLITNSACARASPSGVTPASGLSALIGCTTVQCRAKNSTKSRSSASSWNSRSRVPLTSSNQTRLTFTLRALSCPGAAFVMRNMSPRPPSYGATIADSLNWSRMRGRVSRAISSPPIATSVIGPISDSNTISQLAVVPTAYIAPVPVVVNTPTLNANACRKGSLRPIPPVPCRAVGPIAE